MAKRMKAMGVPRAQGTVNEAGWTGEIALGNLYAPNHWKQGRLIFVNSMSDLFHPGVSDEVLRIVWGVMEANQQHQFMILTKRAEAMRAAVERLVRSSPLAGSDGHGNIWLGVTIEDSSQTENRLRELAYLSYLGFPTFISAEPLLDDINLDYWSGVYEFDPDWVVVGGESGPRGRARVMPVEAVMAVYEYCQDAGVKFFFKQWGDATSAFLHRTKYSIMTETRQMPVRETVWEK
jgi:protein gp37